MGLTWQCLKLLVTLTSNTGKILNKANKIEYQTVAAIDKFKGALSVGQNIYRRLGMCVQYDMV